MREGEKGGEKGLASLRVPAPGAPTSGDLTETRAPGSSQTISQQPRPRKTVDGGTN